MSADTIKKALENFGLTEKEAEIYIFLAKHGILSAGEISKLTKTHRPHMYRLLQNLQKKGVVQSTLESPVRYFSVPFEKVLDENIKLKQEEASMLEKEKNGLLTDWKNVSSTKSEPDVGSFLIIEGNRKIYSKISQMISQTKIQFSAILPVSGIERGEQFGAFDTIYTHPFKSKVNFQLLTQLTNQNLKAAKLLKTKLKAGLNLKGINPGSSFDPLPRMVIRDNEEVLFFISPKSEIFRKGQDETCICTDNRSLVQALAGIFRDLWPDSTDIENKILEIETGKTPTETSPSPEKAIMDYERALTKIKEQASLLPEITAELKKIEDLVPNLVGREKELSRLEEASKKALRWNGNTILISGEAGIGKTRLAKELAAYATSQNFKVLECSSSHESSLPLWSVRKALESLFNITKQDNPKMRRDKIGKIFEESAPEFAQQTQGIDDIIAGFPTVTSAFATDSFQMDLEDLSFFEDTKDLTALSQFLVAVSERLPIMLLFDDLHLAESATLRFFRILARAIKESRVFLVGAYRQEALPKTAEGTNHPFLDFWQSMKKDALHQEIELKRLNSNNSIILVNSILGTENDLLAQRVHKETEGNPFFLIETLKFLINKKMLIRLDDKWKLARNLNDIEMPPTIRDAITRRIQILREEERDILDCASVAGEAFTSDLIENVTGFDRLRVLKKLNYIEREYQLIHSSGTNYWFDHSKVREVLYQDIAVELRREYHSLVGKYLEEAFKENLGEVLSELAHHYFMSGKTQKAVPYLLEAGRTSSKEYAIFETIRYFSQALKLMEHDEKWSKKRTEIFETLGDLNGIMAEHDQANRYYEEGIASATDEKIKDKLRKKIRRKKIVKSNGVKIAYYICGEGKPTLLLLPSIGITEVFNPQINYFSQKYQVVTLDLRGTGESDKPKGEYTTDTFVSDIESVIEDLQEENVILVGFSAGGLMAIKYVANHPEKVSKLVLWATNPAPLLNIGDERKKRSAAFIEKAKESPSWGVRKFWETIFPQPGSEHLIEWGLKSAQKTPPEIFINSLGNYRKEDVRSLLAKINVPTLILLGEKCAIPHEKIEFLRKNIADSSLHTFEITEDSLPGGSFPNPFKGDKCNRILEQFITTGKMMKN